MPRKKRVALGREEARERLEKVYARHRNAWLPRVMFESGPVVVGEKKPVGSVGGQAVRDNSDTQRRGILYLLSDAGYIVLEGAGAGQTYSWVSDGAAFVFSHPRVDSVSKRRRRGVTREEGEAVTGPASGPSGATEEGALVLVDIQGEVGTPGASGGAAFASPVEALGATAVALPVTGV